jgi:hypothetical protein
LKGPDSFTESLCFTTAVNIADSVKEVILGMGAATGTWLGTHVRDDITPQPTSVLPWQATCGS